MLTNESNNTSGSWRTLIALIFKFRYCKGLTNPQHVMDKTPVPNGFLFQKCNPMCLVGAHELFQQGMGKGHASGISHYH